MNFEEVRKLGYGDQYEATDHLRRAVESIDLAQLDADGFEIVPCGSKIEVGKKIYFLTFMSGKWADSGISNVPTTAGPQIFKVSKETIIKGSNVKVV